MNKEKIELMFSEFGFDNAYKNIIILDKNDNIDLIKTLDYWNKKKNYYDFFNIEVLNTYFKIFTKSNNFLIKEQDLEYPYLCKKCKEYSTLNIDRLELVDIKKIDNDYKLYFEMKLD